MKLSSRYNPGETTHHLFVEQGELLWRVSCLTVASRVSHATYIFHLVYPWRFLGHISRACPLFISRA